MRQTPVELTTNTRGEVTLQGIRWAQCSANERRSAGMGRNYEFFFFVKIRSLEPSLFFFFFCGLLCYFLSKLPETRCVRFLFCLFVCLYLKNWSAAHILVCESLLRGRRGFRFSVTWYGLLTLASVCVFLPFPRFLFPSFFGLEKPRFLKNVHETSKVPWKKKEKEREKKDALKRCHS